MRQITTLAGTVWISLCLVTPAALAQTTECTCPYVGYIESADMGFVKLKSGKFETENEVACSNGNQLKSSFKAVSNADQFEGKESKKVIVSCDNELSLVNP